MTLLAHSPADVLRLVLIAVGQGTDPAAGGAWPIFAASEPPSPDQVVTVYDTTGMDDGSSMIDGELWQHFGFQVRVRASTHAVGWTKASQIQTALAKSVYETGVHLDSSAYLVSAVASIGQVLVLGKESPTSKRSLFTVNAIVAMRQVS